MRTFNRRFSYILILLFLLPVLWLTASCSKEKEENGFHNTLLKYSNQEIFYQTLKTLCGQEFYGKTTYPDDPDHEMVGADLYMRIASCTDKEIRMPFMVNDDRSRTWVITWGEEGLLLKHDHRYEDGTPEEITQYGGFADHRGTSFRQFFPADDETREMLPEAATNVWMMEIDLKNQAFIYYLERHDKPRYRAEFSFTYSSNTVLIATPLWMGFSFHENESSLQG